MNKKQLKEKYDKSYLEQKRIEQRTKIITISFALILILCLLILLER